MSSAIEQIMKKTGVSRATAYRALTGHSAVSEATRERVLRAASEMDGPVLSRANRTSNRVALWVPGLGQLLSKPHHVATVEAIEETALRRGLSLEVVNASVPDDPADAVALVREKRVRGLMLLMLASKRYLRAFTEHWSVVSFFAYAECDRLTVVAPDDFTAGFRATRHLVDNGHRHIAVAVGQGGIPEAFSQRFVAGYALAMASVGLDVRNEWVLRDGLNLKTFGSGGKEPPACEAFLALEPRPTAIIARTETAVGLMLGFSKRGIRVPGEVSLVCHGPHEQSAWPGIVPSRTMYSTRSMAEAAFDALEARGRRFRKVTVPVAMDPGGSVKALKKSGKKRV
jgi:DNA-binding LacI/PurR family transcriptional regulator